VSVRVELCPVREDVAAQARRVAEHIRGQRAEVVQAIFLHVREAVPINLDGWDAAYRAGVLAAIGAVLDHGLAMLEHGPDWPAPLPPAAAAQARAAARSGVSCATVLRRYLAGHHRLGDLITEELDRLDLPDSASVLHHVRHTLEVLMERLSAAIEHEHEQELRRLHDTPARRRLALVRGLLSGGVSVPAALAGLGYDFGVWHLAVIAHGAYAQVALDRLRVHGPVLGIRVDEQTAWGWLACRARPTEPLLALICAEVSRGASLALGEPSEGLDGWRRSHHQAEDALQVALMSGQPSVRYADVALIAPWLAMPDGGRSLIDLYLAPLEAEGDQGATARRTLRAYLSSHRNVSAAAARLGVNRRTVAYRLRNIEDSLGYPLDRRLAGLEVALCLHELLYGSDCTTWQSAAR
jgi:hypothetical protein